MVSAVVMLYLQPFPLHFDSNRLCTLETNLVWRVVQHQITPQLTLSLTWCDILWNNCSDCITGFGFFFVFLLSSTFSLPSLSWGICVRCCESWVYEIWVQDVLCTARARPSETGGQHISINNATAPVKAVLLFLACKPISCQITTCFSWGSRD